MNKFSIDMREEIKELLENKAELRDDTLKLVFTVWLRRLKNHTVYKTEMLDFLQQLLNLHRKGVLPSPETITRNKRKVQELNEHLAGDKKKRDRQQEYYREQFKS